MGILRSLSQRTLGRLATCARPLWRVAHAMAEPTRQWALWMDPSATSGRLARRLRSWTERQDPSSFAAVPLPPRAFHRFLRRALPSLHSLIGAAPVWPLDDSPSNHELSRTPGGGFFPDAFTLTGLAQDILGAAKDAAKDLEARAGPRPGCANAG